MAYTPKDWRDLPDHSTPITAAALEDLETRVTDYADTLPLGDTFNNTYNVTLDPGVSVDQAIDVWGSEADPGSVTDWGVVVNSLLAADERHLFFGAHDFPITTTIDAHGLRGVRFEGNAAWDWHDSGSTVQTRLIWKNGAGSGNMINLTGANPSVGAVGSLLRNLKFVYDNAAYDGVLIDYLNGTMHRIEGCFFGSKDDGVRGGAEAAISLDGVNTIDVTKTTFMGAESFLSAVRGRENGGTSFCNIARFDECTFQGGVNAAVTNPGMDWLFSHCDFEFPDLAAGKPMITTDFTYATDSVILTLRDCAYWDASGGTQKVVYAPSGNDWAFAAYDCNDHSGAVGNLAALYDLQCNGSVDIVGGGTSQVIDVGDASDTTKRKRAIKIDMDIYSAISATDRLLNVNTGHGSADVSSANKDWRGEGVSGQLQTVAHEWLGGVDVPSVAAHAGVADHDFAIYGNDMMGFLLIHNGGVGTGPTGMLADITLAAPPDVYTSVSTHSRLPVVVLGVYVPDDGGGDFVSPSPATTWTCQPYVQAASIANGGSQAEFSVGVVAGIPAGGRIGVSYRVAHK